MSSKKIGLCMVLAGIVFLALKLSFSTGLMIYPEYETDYKISSEFQAYTMNYFYGASSVDSEELILDVHFTGFSIDIFCNIIGYILVIIGTSKIMEVSKVFSLSKLLAIIGLVFAIIIEVLPFVFNGSRLCYISLAIGVAELFAALSVSYLFIYGICTILDDIAYKTDRKAIGLSYIGMCICMLVVAVVGWVSAVSGVLLAFYMLLCAFVTGLLVFNIYKVSDYIIKERGLE